MKENGKFYFWLTLPVLAFVFLVARVYAVLPAVMQDEYVYSTESRLVPFAEQVFPNYLFSFVYQSTNICGENYYSCAKNLNIAFFIALLVFIYLIAARLLGRNYAVATVTLTIFSPIGESISFYMPETMYFAFMVTTVWFALKAAERQSSIWWLYTGIMLGLTALVKPHGLFALPVLVIFAIFISRRSLEGTWKAGFVNALIVLSSTLVLKFGLGFVFAGSSGLTFFGSGYGGTVGAFVGSANQESNSASSANVPTIFASTSFLQLIMHFSLLLLVWGIPILLSLSVIRTALFTKKEITPLGVFVTLTGALAITYSVVVAFFEAMVTVLGDDHSKRVITRYYDFVIPLLIVLAFAVNKYVEPKTWVRAVQSGVITLAVIWTLVYFPTGVTPKVADSIPLMGLLYQPWVLYLVGGIVIALQLVWLFKAESGSKALSLAVTPLLVFVIGISGQSSLIEKIGTQKAYFDVAGQTVKPYLSEVPGREIIVIGSSRPEVVTAKFWIDKANIGELLVSGDGTINLTSLADRDYALFLGTSEIQGVGNVVINGDKFVLVKVLH